MSDQPARQRYRELVVNLTLSAHAYARDVVLDASNVTEGTGERAWRTSTAALRGIEETVKAGSFSSSPFYAERDLPPDMLARLAELRHYVRILNSLYGPQETRVNA